jgi:hypothetical protein
MSKSLKLCALMLFASLSILLVGCGATGAIERQAIVASGPGVDIDQVDLTAFRENQDKVLRELAMSAGVEPIPNTKDGLIAGSETAPAETSESKTLSWIGRRKVADADWDRIVYAGIDYADKRCEDYLQALHRVNRDKNTVVKELGLAGTASAGVLAALDAAARNVAITAVLFGFSSASVDNLASNLLFDLEPSSVRTLVKTLQRAYTANLQHYTTRPAAVAAIRGYAELCLPTNIESEVNLAVKKAQPAVSPGDPEKSQPPSVTNAQAQTFTFGGSKLATLLDSFAFTNNALNENGKALQKYLVAKGIKPEQILAFIWDPKAFSDDQRREALQFFNVIK